MSHSPYSASHTRRNVMAFLIGKVPTALLTASILGLSARNLDASEFGRYIVVMAALEIVVSLSTFGLDWVILRAMPGYRLHGGQGEMLGLIGKVVVVRATILLPICATLLALPKVVPGGIGQLPMDLVGPFAVLVFIEGISRIVRDNTMEALAIQSRLQIAMIAKSLIVVGTLLWFGYTDKGSAELILYAEASGSLIAGIIGGTFVLCTIRGTANVRGDWIPPSRQALARIAYFNYTSSICEYLFSPTFLIILMGKFQPAAQVAGVGFVLRLTELIRAYLPGMLVAGVVRASMIGAYVRDRNFNELQAWANFLFKISLLTLLPVIGIVAIHGRPLLELVSSGRYGDYHWLFLALTIWLVFRLHRLVLGVVFNALDLMRAWSRASFCSLIVVPLLLLIGPERLGIWFVAVALLSTEVTMNIFGLFALARDGRTWHVGWKWITRSVAGLAVACGMAFALPKDGWGVLIGSSALLCFAYCAAAIALRVFDRADQELVNRSTGKPIFRNVQA